MEASHLKYDVRQTMVKADSEEQDLSVQGDLLMGSFQLNFSR